MRSSRPKRKGNWIAIICTIAICIALLFWLEWLGSERPQQSIEKPLEIPTVPVKAG